MFRYDNINSSEIIDDKFAFETQNNKESLLTIGNGLFGLRGVYEEKIPYEKRGFFCSGTYCIAGDFKEELVNLPDISEIQLSIDGKMVHLLSSNMISSQRTLNLVTGELKRIIHWKSARNQMVHITFTRVFSMNNPHLFLQSIEINSLDSDLNGSIKIGIDAEITNQGYMHLGQMKKQVVDNSVMVTTTPMCVMPSKKINILMGLKQDSKWIKGSFHPTSKKIEGTYKFQAHKQEPLSLTKITYIYFDDYSTDMLNNCLKSSISYKNVVQDNKNETLTHFSVNADLDTLSKIKLSIYHMNIMTPRTKSASIGAKGLSGEGYRGHIFWDTEIFMFPYYLLTNPSVAKALLNYRFDRLSNSREIAKSRGYLGAMVPWESADSGYDQTPEFSAINIHTGKPTKIMSGEKELHVTLAVMYAICQYFIVTNDLDFMNSKGIMMLEEYSMYWLSKAVKTSRGYEILDVIGPDEYTESINNNYYTNYLLKKCLEISLDFYLDGALIQRVRDFIPNIYFPRPNGFIIPQDDTFLSKPVIDVEKYLHDAGSQSILKDYSRDEVIDLQVLKQADLILLFELFPDDFDEQVKTKNFNYYEPKTIHDSSLSKATHSIVAFDIGQTELAERYFKDSLNIDFTEKSYSQNGIHAASMYRPFWVLFRGILGGYITSKGILSFSPKRQSLIKDFNMEIHCFGRLLKIEYGDDLKITLISGAALTILFNHKEFHLESQIIYKF